MNGCDLLAKLEMSSPIFLAGMAGGVTTPELVSQVSESGGLGQIGAGYMTPESLSNDIDRIRTLTSKPVGVNLFIPEFPKINQSEVNQMNEILKPIAEKLNYDPVHKVIIENCFDEMIDIIIEKGIELVSFTFGKPEESLVRKLQNHRIVVVGTATNELEAKALYDIGVDAVVLQGSEAGGHRGSFNQTLPEKLYTTESLFDVVSQQLDIPLIVAGGITTPELAKVFLNKGATAVQLGTAFLTTKESGIPEVHKESILNAKSDDISLTKAFSGRYANGIHNTFIHYLDQFEDEICSYPIQNILTQPMRGQSKKMQNREFMNLWCGTNPEGARKETVSELMSRYK